MSRLGTVQSIHRYPVKSMRGESVSQVLVHSGGLTGDRVYAFVDPDKDASFPWLTARQVAEMILFEPRFENTPAVDTPFPERSRFRVTVRTPEGSEHPIDDPAFLEQLKKRWSRSFTLRFSELGQADACPVSILGLASVDALSQDAGIPLDPLRFRPNLLIAWDDPAPYFEDTLVGSRIRIGDKVELLVTERDTRCTIVNLEPKDASASPQVLKTVGQVRKGCVGVYASVIREGVVRAGDLITRVSHN